VAFDVAPTAIAWCRRRFSTSSVTYAVCDLFDFPSSWRRAFDFVLESYTLEVLPPEIRNKAFERIAGLVAPGGAVLVICRGRNKDEEPGDIPWPLTKAELAHFISRGLYEKLFSDYQDNENPPVRRFLVEYSAPREGVD
jgi:hypothetical protein